MTYTFVTLAERPELEAEMPRLHSESWPEFVINDPVAIRYWGSLFSTFADFQYVLCDEQGNALAAGHTIPLVWDGTREGLPPWSRALAILSGISRRPPSAGSRSSSPPEYRVRASASQWRVR